MEKSGEILKLSGGRYTAYIWNRKELKNSFDAGGSYAYNFEDYKKMCYDRDHGRFLTPDGLRVICEGLNRNPEAIGKHILETLAQMQSKG